MKITSIQQKSLDPLIMSATKTIALLPVSQNKSLIQQKASDPLTISATKIIAQSLVSQNQLTIQ